MHRPKKERLPLASGCFYIQREEKTCFLVQNIAHDQMSSKFYICVLSVLALSLPIKSTDVEKQASCRSPISLRTGYHVACGGKQW